MDQKPEQNLGSMIESILNDVNSLIRGHIELAKAEIQASVKNAMQSSALFIIAVGFGHFALIMLLISAGYGLVALGLSPWLAFLILAITILLLGGLAMWLAIKRIKKVRGPVKTFDSISATAQTLRNAAEN